MVWTPFGKSTTSTATDVVNDMAAPMEPVIAATYPQQAMVPQVQEQVPQQAPHEEPAWFNGMEMEGQLAVDVYQTAVDIVIKAPIAGVLPKDIEITMTDDVLTVKGHRRVEENVSAQDYYCQECYYGVFSRSIILPVAVLTDQANATFSNGILTITIPKAANARTKKLEVKAL
jgi:HSP20 family molecular chaperone IbpA